MNNKIFNGLGLAMRAGKLISGDEAVLKSVRAGEAVLVVMAVDASDNMRKKYQDKCSSFSVKLLEYGLRTELGAAIGKPERVIMAITDKGFARMILKIEENSAEVDHID